MAISETTIRWTSDQAKFQDIILNRSYEEDLGKVSNFMWRLQIFHSCIPREYTVKVQKSHDETDGGVAELSETVTYSNYLWRFNLIRDSTNLHINVDAKLFSGTNIVAKDLYFHDGLESASIGTLDTTKLANFKVVMFLTFGPSYKTDGNFKGDNQICSRNVPRTTLVSKLDGLSRDLFDLYDKQHSADVLFKVGPAAIKGHKNILSARSPVLKTLLKTNRSSAINEYQELDISGIDPLVFRALLTFLYSGKVNVDSADLAKDLSAAATRFQVYDLKEGIDNLYKLNE